MIIQNGTIEFKGKTAGGIDPTTGYPIAPTTTWGDPIPVQWIPNSHDNLGVTHGEHFTRASYTLLISRQALPSEQLRLKDRAGNTIGEFSVISAEDLDAVLQTRILI